jgi:hypothetical protein
LTLDPFLGDENSLFLEVTTVESSDQWRCVAIFESAVALLGEDIASVQFATAFWGASDSDPLVAFVLEGQGSGERNTSTTEPFQLFCAAQKNVGAVVECSPSSVPL